MVKYVFGTDYYQVCTCAWDAVMLPTPRDTSAVLDETADETADETDLFEADLMGGKRMMGSSAAVGGEVRLVDRRMSLMDWYLYTSDGSLSCDEVIV